MQKSVLLYVFILLFTKEVTSQIVLERKIKWTTPKEMVPPYRQDEIPQIRLILHFENAVYQNTENPFPYFNELIPVDDSFKKYTVSIKNEIFEDLTQVETSALNLQPDFNVHIIPEIRLMAQRKSPYLNIEFIPLRRNPNTQRIEKLVSFEIHISFTTKKSSEIFNLNYSYSPNSVLSNGKWVKIGVENDGVYQITWSELQSMGFENPSNIRLFGNGNKMLPLMNSEPRLDDLEEKAIFIEMGQDGIFNQGDYILFYGQGPVSWQYNDTDNIFEHSKHLYSKYNYYYLTTLSGPRKLIEDRDPPIGPSTHISETFDDYAFHEEDLYNLIQSGRRWFGELFDIETTRNFSFSFPNIVNTSPSKVKAAFAARSPLSSSFTVSFNQQSVISLVFSSVVLESYVSDYANIKEGSGSFTPITGNVNLTVNYSKPTPSSQGWLDYLILNSRRNLIMTGPQMHFRDIQTIGAGNITEFRISEIQQGLRVWEVTDTKNVKNIAGETEGGTYSFKHETDELFQFIAFYNTSFLKPIIVGNVPNQNLHGLPQTDFIIISHPAFFSQAQQLADFRRTNDFMNVAVVTTEQIFNEFSAGKPDVAAYRNFVKMFYDRAVSEADIPKYLLLFGDGSYNNFENSQSNSNFILTFQSENSLRPTQSFVTDDFFGLLDDNEGEHSGLLDIGIGRIPVTTASQAQTVIDKIFRYERSENKGEWQNYLAFIGDDGDNNIHMRDADILADYVRDNYPFFNIDKIYLDAYQRVSGSGGQRYPDVNRAIQNRINRGALLINYTGHGNELRLAHENILDISDILSLKNKNSLPVFMTATCEFSRFDNPQRISGGETLLLHPNGGAVALFSTTRLVYATPNFFLNQNFYKFIFHENEGKFYRLGEVMRLTKNNSGTGINKLNFTLIGDPSMHIAVPKHELRITEINGYTVSAAPDTLKAMGKYTIKGEVEMNGIKAGNYNGLVFPTVFDKTQMITSLSNDGNPPFVFETRNNIIYKGKSSVENGEFSFSFYVPKDIQYYLDTGKISLFSTGNEGDAKGAYFNFLVGGTADSIPTDKQGPAIELFMNDKNFVFGGTTDENPILLAFLTDSTGLNTVGNGIGHDIVAIFNRNTNDPIVLNDFYTAEIDNYQAGSIEYPLSNLKEGNHSVRLKAWDVLNNSSEEFIEFVVAPSAKLALRNVLNYPNPFTNFTSFHFEHNQPGSSIDIIIQIFTISGRLVKTIQTSLFSPGYKPDPIPWDGLDDFGDKIARGVYLYRVKIRTENGQVAEKYEKLVILK